jgi:hypothetical protein
MSVPVQTGQRSTSDVVAGFLATIAIFGSAIGLVEHPVRITVFTILLSLIAAGMTGGSQRRLAAFAVAFSGACFIVGCVLAIVVGKPLF